MRECRRCESFNDDHMAVCGDCGAPLLDDPRLGLVIVKRAPRAKRRLFVDNEDRDTAIGIELLALLQSVTEDGAVTEDEVTALGEWLAENRHVDMPAIAFLSSTVSRIIEDGVITDDERSSLYEAIELTLPPDLRVLAKANRRVREAAEKRAARAAKATALAAEIEARKEERSRNSVVWRINVLVAGVAYEGRRSIVQRYARIGDPVFLVRHKQNKFSKNAIAIFLANGGMIGFVPEYEAENIADLLDSGHRVKAEIWKILEETRAGSDVPVINGAIYKPEAGIDGAHSQAEILAREVEEPYARGATSPPRGPHLTPSVEGERLLAEGERLKRELQRKIDELEGRITPPPISVPSPAVFPPAPDEREKINRQVVQTIAAWRDRPGQPPTEPMPAVVQASPPKQTLSFIGCLAIMTVGIILFVIAVLAVQT